MNLRIIDTSGIDGTSNPLLPSWIRLADAVIFCYDVTSKESLVALEGLIEMVAKISEEKTSPTPNFTQIPSIVIGCKSDIEDSREISQQEGQTFTISKLLKLSGPPKKVKDKTPFFLETSSKSRFYLN
jgi:GTPase SAR1 family protein